MNQQDYKKLLNEHDWYWQMSDSSAIREKGYSNEEKLKSLWKSTNKFEKLFREKSDSIFKPKKPKNARRINRNNGKTT